MKVICPECKKEYDDTYKSTLCPHEPFDMHCTVFVKGKLGCAHTLEEQAAALGPQAVLPNPDCELLKFLELLEDEGRAGSPHETEDD